MNVENTLRDYLVRELRWSGSPAELTPDYGLLENDVLDSMGILKVVEAIEEMFDIEVDDEELLPDNFSSLGSMTTLVESKLAARQA